MKGAGKRRSRRTPAVAQNRARSSRVGGCPDQEQVSPRAIPPPEESTGPEKAILAVAACMLIAAYHILKDDATYAELARLLRTSEQDANSATFRQASQIPGLIVGVRPAA